MQSFTIEEFKKIHQAWKESGLSVRDYCANTGIKESRFFGRNVLRMAIAFLLLPVDLFQWNWMASLAN